MYSTSNMVSYSSGEDQSNQEVTVDLIVEPILFQVYASMVVNETIK